MSDDKKKKKSVANDLGGIFGVAASGKKKKKVVKEVEPVSEDLSAAKSSEELPEISEAKDGSIDAISEAISEAVSESQDMSTLRDTGSRPLQKQLTKASKISSKKNAGLEGILMPGGPQIDASDYLGDDDLGEIVAPAAKSNFLMMAIIGLLVLVIAGMAIMMTGSGDDLMSVFKGNLKEKKLAEKKMLEEAYAKEQKENLRLFGNMLIDGYPKFSEIRINGKKYYGRTSKGEWREVRIGTTNGIQDLEIKKTHNLEVSLPGYESRKDTVKQDMWQPATGAAFGYAYNATLTPKSEIEKSEFDARMSQDSENEFFGKVTLTSNPAGATVRFANEPLLDEKGNALKTPVTFSKWYAKDKKTGKLVGNDIRVDSTIDRGHKIQLSMEYPNSCPDALPACGVSDGCCPSECTVATDMDCKSPKIVDALNRQMWTCNWKDGAAPKEIAKGKSIQHYCDYSFTYNYDIDAIKNFIVEGHKEREAIKAEAKAFKEAQKQKRLDQMNKK